MERRKQEYYRFKQEQLRISGKGAPQKYQQEFFLHAPFSSETSDSIYQATSQYFMSARSEALLLFLDNKLLTKDARLAYDIDMPDRNLPFYMRYMNEEYMDSEREHIGENRARVDIFLSPKLGESDDVNVRMLIEKDFARGELLLDPVLTIIRLPYHPYTAHRDERIRDDARRLRDTIASFSGRKPRLKEGTIAMFPKHHANG